MKTLLGSVPLLVALAAGPALAQEKPPAQKPKEGEPKEATEKRRQRVKTIMAGFEMLSPEKLLNQMTIVGATRGIEPAPPFPLAPFLGKALGPQPTFRWDNPGKAKEFVFVLTDELGREVLRKTVAESRYRYDGPPLDPGQIYEWSVQTSAGASGAVAFRLADAKERQQVEAALAKLKAGSYEAALARARALAEHRLWYEAVDAYSILIAQYPDRAEAYEERGAIYSQTPRTEPAAAADFARADVLQPR